MSDNTAGSTANKYTFTVATSPDEVTAAIINGSVDIAAVPSNLASVLYTKTKGEVEVMAVNTLGVLYLLENGNTINSVEDLRGKTICASGQASTPEYVLRYILKQNGIDPDTDVTIKYYSAHAELATLMSSGDVVLGMLPEPNVTAVMSANANVHIALNLTDEWNKVSGGASKLIMGCIIVNRAFAEANKPAVDAFLDEYKGSIDYVNANNAEASQLIADNGIIPKSAVAEKALPNCNIVYIDGDEMKKQLSGFLGVLFEANPASVGGTMPDDAFYYKK
jgi:NitT/TauT family transport system substrate-binding protein